MAEKKSFLLYISSFKQIRKLTQEQKGVLLDAIMNFQEGVPLPEMDPLVDMCFGFIADDMQRDAEKYEEIVEKRRESGRKGGLQKQANLANATFARNEGSTGVANLANLAVNVDVNDDVNEDVNVDVNENESAPGGRQHQTTTHIDTSSGTDTTGRPSNLDVLGELVSKGYQLTPASIKAFMDYNDERGWKMDWRLALKRWADREVQHPPDQPVNKAGKFANFEQRNDPKHKAMVAQLIEMQTAGGKDDTG